MNFEELLVAALKRQGFGAADAEEIADWYLCTSETPFPANFWRAVLAANGYDPSQPRNADGEWTAGGGARPREPETKPQHDRYGSTDEATLAADPQKNFKRGANALEAVMRRRGGYIDDAMFREESGWIRFDWGDPGNPHKDYEHGHGISHIAEKHPRDLKKLPGIIANGRAVKDPAEPDKTYFVTETAFAVVIPLNQTGRRILTGFEPSPDSKKLAAIKNYPPAPKLRGTKGG